MYQILVRIIGRYAPIVTLPVAVILGGIGYMLESSLRKGPPPSNGESTIKEREDRLLNNENQTLELPRKNIFDKNDPNLLRR